jgi:hypothetical protein
MKGFFLAIAMFLVSCASTPKESKLEVSIKDQRARLVSNNHVIKTYLVSTGRGGVGNKPRSHQTPLGLFRIVKEIGEGMPLNTGFKGGVPTPNIRGQDPIISRVLFIDGLEPQNRNSINRLIRLHGSPYVQEIGKPVSMGCVRFTPWDIASVCHYVHPGDLVEIK